MFRLQKIGIFRPYVSEKVKIKLYEYSCSHTHIESMAEISPLHEVYAIVISGKHFYNT